MSLATWHPPPVTHIGFPNSTSNSEYGKWSPMPSNGHYAPVSLATSTPSSPWPNQKSRNSTSSYDSSDWNNSYNRKSDVINGGNGVSLPENTSSYPFANEVRKNGMLEQLNGENRKSRQIDANNNNSNISNDGRTTIYTYADPATRGQLFSRTRLIAKAECGPNKACKQHVEWEESKVTKYQSSCGKNLSFWTAQRLENPAPNVKSSAH